jgi:plastocyanin domain-containing protein
MIINMLGFGLIGLIIWWFWLYKPKETKVLDNEISIEVKDGVYMPSHIKCAVNEPIVLSFLRRDKSPCSEMLLIPALEISETLTIDKPTKIALTISKAGEFDFHCQMQMYRGVLKVE